MANSMVMSKSRFEPPKWHFLNKSRIFLRNSNENPYFLFIFEIYIKFHVEPNNFFAIIGKR
jgi:hypothetical protein